MKSTPEMRARIRELMTRPQDDYDRAVECVLDDLESLIPGVAQSVGMREALVSAQRIIERDFPNGQLAIDIRNALAQPSPVGSHGDGYCGCTERCRDRDNCQYDVKPASQPSPTVPVEECPRPVIPDHSAKACVESGNCGCGAKLPAAPVDDCPACHGDGYFPKEDLSGDTKCEACEGTGLPSLSAATGDEPDSRLPLQYEDGPDYCTVKDAQGRDFALTMQPELMRAMEQAKAANKPAIDPKKIAAIDDFLADGQRDKGYRAFAMMRHIWPQLRELALASSDDETLHRLPFHDETMAGLASLTIRKEIQK